jgi:hypothetical protein
MATNSRLRKFIHDLAGFTFRENGSVDKGVGLDQLLRPDLSDVAANSEWKSNRDINKCREAFLLIGIFAIH